MEAAAHVADARSILVEAFADVRRRDDPVDALHAWKAPVWRHRLAPCGYKLRDQLRTVGRCAREKQARMIARGAHERAFDVGGRRSDKSSRGSSSFVLGRAKSATADAGDAARETAEVRRQSRIARQVDDCGTRVGTGARQL
jgi:hypothetical protein